MRKIPFAGIELSYRGDRLDPLFLPFPTGIIVYTYVYHTQQQIGHQPVSYFSLSIEMSRLTRDGTAEPVSRDQILRHERGQGNVINFPCSADHVQD